MPGRRHDRAGARRQALGPRRRRARGFRARQADPRAVVPARRPSRAQRRRIGDEARHQPAAHRLLGGAGRGAVAGARSRHRAAGDGEGAGELRRRGPGRLGRPRRLLAGRLARSKGEEGLGPRKEDELGRRKRGAAAPLPRCVRPQGEQTGPCGGLNGFGRLMKMWPPPRQVIVPVYLIGPPSANSVLAEATSMSPVSVPRWSVSKLLMVTPIEPVMLDPAPASAIRAELKSKICNGPVMTFDPDVKPEALPSSTLRLALSPIWTATPLLSVLTLAIVFAP